MSTEAAPCDAVARSRGTAARARPVPLWRRPTVLLLVVGWAAQVVLRLWLASGQTMPVAIPDESGYLFAGRVITGGAGADMSYGTVYQAGYPLLLLPAHWIADDPVSIYRLCLVINALISALMLPLGYLLLRALDVRRRWSLLFGNVIALLPGVVFYSGFLLTDAVLPVVITGWLLLTRAWLAETSPGARRPTTLYGVAAALLVAFAWAIHTRGAILLVVHVGLMITAVLLRWRPWRGTGLAALVLAAALAGGALLNRALLPHLYPGGDNDLTDNLVRRVTTADGWAWMLSLGTGQIWYSAVATGGLAAVGLVTLAFFGVRRGTPGRDRALALALLAFVVGVAVATSAALPDESRIGNLVYGRYLACVTPVLVAVGIAVLLRAPPRRLARAAGAAVAVIATAALVVDWHAGDRLRRSIYVGYDFPETSLLTFDWSAFRLWHATLAGLVLLGLLALAARLPRRGPELLASLLVAVSLAMVITATARISRPSVREKTEHSDLRAITDVRSLGSIAVDWNVPWRLRVSFYYWAWWADGSILQARGRPPLQDVDMVVLWWPEDAAPEQSWPDGAPAGWHVVEARRTAEGDWVAWMRR